MIDSMDREYLQRAKLFANVGLESVGICSRAVGG